MIFSFKAPRSGFIRLFLFAGFLLCGAFSVYGQTSAVQPIRLTPNQAVELAVRNNLNLEMAREGLDIKKRKNDLVWNEFLPNLGINGTLSRSNWAMETSGNLPVPLNTLLGLPPEPRVNASTPVSVTLPNWNVMGNFSADLTFSFALIQGIRSFKEDYRAGVLSYDKAVLQVEQGIRKMYNGILLLEANEQLLLETFENVRRQAAIAEANFNAGLAPRLTWLQAQVALENLRPSVNDLENNLKNLKGNFALLLGLPYNTPFELDSLSVDVSYIPDDVEQLISRAAAGKPDILELQAGIITMQTQRKALGLSQYTPYLRFGYTLSTMFNPRLDPFSNSWFTGENWNKGGNGTGGAFSITLGMSFNSLFNFTKEGQQRKDMDAGLRVQHLRLAQMIRETELEIFSKINSLEKIRTSKEAQQAAVDLAEQSYRLTEEAYRAGLQDFQAVQNSSLALSQSKLQLLTQQFNYVNDLIDLEYSLGIPFGTLSSGSVK